MSVTLEQKREAKRKYARERAKRLRQDPVYRQLELQRNARWRRDNPDALKVSRSRSHRRWYLAHKDEKLQDNKRWKEEHPEVVRAYQARRVQISSTIKLSNYESREYAAILYADPCSYCGEPACTVDHIIPSDAGGENHWTNFTGACGPCNSSKGITPLLEFLCRV